MISTRDPRDGLSAAAFSSLFQSIDGLRNRRALAALLSCMAAGVLVAGLCTFVAARGGMFFAFLGGVAMFLASATGINAAGLLLMDQARGVPPRSFRDALVVGFMCIPKFILLGLTLLAVAVAVFIALALLYVVCKIPLLGTLLFVVVFPASVVVLGLTLCALTLCMFLALPAIWEGASIGHALTQTLAIARSRLLESILLLGVVGVISAAVGFIVFGVLFAGLMPSVGLSAAILGGDGLGSMFGLMRSRSEFGDDGSVAVGGAGHALAASIGAGLLWALASSLLSLVYLLGLNLVYLRVTEGLDVDGASAALKAGIDEARRQAVELGQKAREAAERGREQARQAAARASAASAGAMSAAPSPVRVADVAPREQPPESTAPAVAKAHTCPQCLSSAGGDDVFCSVCGHRLK